jgi:hypothetical protein
MNKTEIVTLVNAAIAKSGGTAKLKYSRVGGSFFYFEIGDRGVPSNPYPDHSTVEQLLEAWKVEEVLEKLNPRDDCYI